MLSAYDGENQEALKEYLTSIGHNVIEHFAILDLDDDRLPEMVLPCSNSKNAEAGDADWYCILDYQNGQVYYYPFSNREFDHVKIDGTFSWTGGICYNGFATLSFVEDKQEGTPFTYDRFTYKDYYESDPETGEWTGYDLIVNHQNVSEAEYDAAWKAEDNKPDVTWHELTEENIIKVSSAPIIDGSIPDPPITTAATSVPFVVGAPVVDKQVFDMTDRNVIEALNAYYAVLADNAPFICFSDCYRPVIDENVKNLTQLIDLIAPRKFRRFAMIDLDNDNIPEVVLSNGEYEDDFFIFKYHAGHVFVYRRVIKSFDLLKIDGTFSYTHGAGSFLFESGITSEYDMLKIDCNSGNIFYYYINSEPVTEEEYLEADAYQDSKPDADWYEFTEENIINTFPQNSEDELANTTDKDVNYEEIYNRFLSGQIAAVDKKGYFKDKGETISVSDFNRGSTTDSPVCDIHSYAIYDMNGDDIPELIVRNSISLVIFWIYNNELTLWHVNAQYAKPLNNMALLYKRPGGAPTHTAYQYFVLGYQGEELYRIVFTECYDWPIDDVNYGEKYFINDTEVTKAIYDSLSERFLHISDDKIEWQPYPY